MVSSCSINMFTFCFMITDKSVLPLYCQENNSRIAGIGHHSQFCLITNKLLNHLSNPQLRTNHLLLLYIENSLKYIFIS